MPDPRPSDDAPPLAGLRVLDLSRVLAGPLCTMILGDLGADVIKVERPGSGDDTRQWGPPWSGDESAYFLCVNRNKRSVAADLKSEAGQALVRRLAQRADVVVENFAPGMLEGWGLGYGDLALDNPRLVFCSITGYGSGGPEAGRSGYDFAVQARAGWMAITGEPEGAPGSEVGAQLPDLGEQDDVEHRPQVPDSAGAPGAHATPRRRGPATRTAAAAWRRHRRRRGDRPDPA